MVVAMVRQLLAAGVSPGDIGVVTPYLAQVGLGVQGGWGPGVCTASDLN